ncbi:MAG: MBL fold metallo-hydrolase [Thermoproteota archaeon]|nr:MAG: MBL fold metallo-hydrolase [Candidatus Korarchaeota archaeon]
MVPTHQPGLELRLGNGIEIREGRSRILLDPKVVEAGVPIFITHAHSDHVPRGLESFRGPVYATPPTARVLRARYGARRGALVEVEYGEEVRVGPLRITPLRAGHIVGSAMFLVEGEGSTLYTGDVNPRGGLLEGPAEPREADVLVIEATYGSPEFVFPDQARVRVELALWAAGVAAEGLLPAIEAYPVGKAQEVIAALNRFTELEVAVSRSVRAVTDALGEYAPLRYSDSVEGPAVLVTGRAVPGPRRIAAVATGWTLLGIPRGYDAGFPLSCHADFPGLMEIVERVSPELALTVYGRTRRLARAVSEMLGIEARPLGSRWVTR